MQAFKIYIIVRLTSHPHHSLGPVAHLVERLICTEEAGSSNLLWSTYDSRQHASVAGFVVVRPEKIRKTEAGTLWAAESGSTVLTRIEAKRTIIVSNW